MDIVYSYPTKDMMCLVMEKAMFDLNYAIQAMVHHESKDAPEPFFSFDHVMIQFVLSQVLIATEFFRFSVQIGQS